MLWVEKYKKQRENKDIKRQEVITVRILFICGNGVSSGMIASRTAKVGKEKGENVETEAYSFAELSEVIDDFDAVLVAPQMKCNETMVQEICEEHGKKYAIIDNFTFSTLNGAKCLDVAKTLL